MSRWWLLIGLNFGLLAWLNWACYGHYQIDTYQSFYVVAAIARGESPYTDFAYYFGPLAIGIYAAVMKITGVHLATLYGLGLATVAAMLPLLWLLARELGLPVHLRAGCCLVFLNAFAFNQSYVRLFNWVVPYCHSSTHSILMLTGGLLFQFHWHRHRTRSSALGWGLCAAGVILNRPDLGCAYALISLLDGAIASRARSAEAVTWLVGFLLPTVAIYGWYASRIGWSRLLFENLLWVGHDPRVSVQQRAIFVGASEHLQVLAGVLVLHLAGWLLVERLGPRWHRWSASLAALAMTILIVPYYAFYDIQLLLALLLALSPGLERRQKIVAVVSFVLLSRIFFRCILISYMSHLGVIPAVLLIALAWQSARAVPARQTLLSCLVFLLSAQYAIRDLTISRELTKAVESPYGLLRLLPTPGSASLQAVLQRLQREGAEHKSVLVLPEGAFLNVMSGSRHPLYHPTFMPTTIAVYGEEALIRQIQQARPDFIVLQHRGAPEYGSQSRFGIDYGGAIRAWIHSHYRLLARYGPEPFRNQSYEDGGVLLYGRKDADEAGGRLPANEP
jgi:hypothetical protein